jgi:predicted ABC-type transport system involved in lysophospholipase L1 biosynthesis ATPase subunit
VAIARALAGDPPILVADSRPVTWIRRQWLRCSLFERLVADGRAVLMVTAIATWPARRPRCVVADGEIFKQ